MARKEKRYHYLYKTTNILTGRYYYGMHSTDNLDDDYLGSGKRLRRSLNKYGKENHKKEIIEYCSDRTSLKKRENELINLNEIAKKDCMNLMVGGSGGAQSPEKQRNWIIAGSNARLLKLKNDPEFREKTINNLNFHRKENHKSGKYSYNTFEGKNHSEETKLKMSIKASERTGHKNSQYGTCWITNGIENKKIFKGDEIPDGWKLGRKI